MGAEKGMDVRQDADFERAFLVKTPMQDLPSVLHKFLNTRDVIDTEDKVEQLTYEVCADMHTESNVRVLELRYAPSFLLDAHPSMDADRMLEAILEEWLGQSQVPNGCWTPGLAPAHQICRRQRTMVRLDFGAKGAFRGA